MIVCQVCGRVALPGSAHWLHEPHRFYDDAYVIRCPEHWSEWALRHTVAGRTTVMRERMREALAQPPLPFPAWLDPFPITGRTTDDGHR